jgi:serine/threonine protein phosphatase 1
MGGRTYVVGDVHGDAVALRRLIDRISATRGFRAEDTLVFLGDYVDRGPDSRGVVEMVMRELPATLPCRVVALRGNHEDAWLRVIDQGWAEFLFPTNNGCAQCFRSFVDRPQGITVGDEFEKMSTGAFFPPDVVDWMRSLPLWYEDEHAIYVHAGLVREDGRWLHPAETPDPAALLWSRSRAFFMEYAGKMVICGHTSTTSLPAEASKYTPDDPTDLWAGDYVRVIDTGSGKGGYLTILELPEQWVYESRDTSF